MIVGVAGTLGSGKGTVADMLKEHGFSDIRLSNFLRSVATEKLALWKETKDENRDVLRMLGDIYRMTLGPGYLVERGLENANPNGKYVIEGLRNPGEVRAIRASGHANIIIADVHKRYEHMRTREMETGRPAGFSTYDEFLHQDCIDDQGDEHGLRLRETLGLSDIIIMNNGTLEGFKQEILDLKPYWTGECSIKEHPDYRFT